ncbi:hypothetical protein M9H77_34901 [Catharanthus roseus]|uniref:Uncharacterized protein n=1 Tax=Catharanthus roseus TaxID=4058 RepID=A0ACB9ZQ07_CATRO|nr:hypothetical protein M9H77_34901 [Catharanthus roseus]
MNGLISTSLCKNCTIFKNPSIYWQLRDHCGLNSRFPYSRFRVQASTNELDKKVAVKKSTEEEIQELEQEVEEKIQNLSSGKSAAVSIATAPLDKDLKKVVQKTAATFAPRASVASKNPAVPGTALYTVFEVQGYVSMLLGGALSFNLIFPSNEPDIWRLMGMWSIWMFIVWSADTVTFFAMYAWKLGWLQQAERE